MKPLLPILICLLIGSSVQQNIVGELNAQNLRKTLNASPYALVLVCNDYCQSYTNYPSQLDEVAAQLAKTNPQVHIFKSKYLDYDRMSDEWYGSVYSLKLFVKGVSTPLSYQGAFTTSEVVSWVQTMIQAITEEAKTVGDIESLTSENEVVVLYFGSSISQSYINVLNSVTTRSIMDDYYDSYDYEDSDGSVKTGSSLGVNAIWDDTVFTYNTNLTIEDQYQVNGQALIVFDKYNNTKQIFEGSFERNDIRKFLGSINADTRISRSRWEERSKFLTGSMDMIFLVRESDETGYQAEKAFREAVKDLRGRMRLQVFQFEDKYENSPTMPFPFTKDDLPAIRIVKSSSVKDKYAYTGDFSASSIKTFVDDYFAGTLSPYFLSEPLPVNEYEDGVRVVVGANFEKIVLDATKDVLLFAFQSEYFNAGVLKDMAPLAEMLNDVEDFVVAKINSDKNEFGGLETRINNGLIFYPKDQKDKPVFYRNFESYESLSLQSYINFLKRYALTTSRSRSGSTGKDIISWVEQTTNAVCGEIKTAKEAQEVIDSHDFVGFFFGSPSSNSFEEALRIILILNEITFAHTDTDEVREKFSIHGEGLVLFDRKKGTREVFGGSYYNYQRYQDILEFIRSSKMFKNMILKEKWQDVYDLRDETALFLLIDEQDEKSQAIEETFRNATQNFRGQITLRIFTYQDSEPYGLSFLNLSSQTLPAIRIVQLSSGRKYVYTGDFTTDSIKTFAESYLEGKLKPLVLSEPIPSIAYDGDVRLVVGDTFSDIVLSDENDVLFLGYTSRYENWTGLKEFSAAATQLKSINNLVFVKMNLDKNEIASGDAREHMMLKLFPRGQKSSPIDLGEFLRESTRESVSDLYVGFLKEYALINCRRYLDPMNPGGDGFDLISWAENITGSLCEEISTVEQAERVILSHNYVGFFFGSASSPSYSKVIRAVIPFGEIAFVHSNSQEVRAHYGVYGETFILFNKFTGDNEVYYGPFESTRSVENQLINFISSSKASQSMIITTGWPYDLLLFIDDSETLFLFRTPDEAGNAAELAFRNAVQEFRGKIKLRVYVSASVYSQEIEINKELFGFLNVTEESLPCIRIIQPAENRQKYAYNGDFSENSIRSFASDFFDGKLQPYFFSQPIPTQLYEDNVTVVVGETFNDIVLNQENDVLLFIYNPFSDYESEILQALSALASRVKDVHNLVIAKIDGSVNEVEGMLELRLPSIRLYPRGKKYSAVSYTDNSYRYSHYSSIEESPLSMEESLLDFLRTYSTVLIPSNI